MADEEMLEVGLPAGSEDLLVRMQRPQPLHRNEQQAEDEQFEDEVVEPRGKRARLVRNRLDLAAAHQRGDHREADADQPVSLRLDQQHRQGAQHERGDDRDLQRSAQQPDVLEIVGPRVVGHEDVRKHEAQLGQDAEHAEHAGRHAGALAEVDTTGRRNLVEQHGRSPGVPLSRIVLKWGRGVPLALPADDEIQQSDEERLMDHVNSKAMASEPLRKRGKARERRDGREVRARERMARARCRSA